MPLSAKLLVGVSLLLVIGLAFAAKYGSDSDSAQPKADSLTPNSYETPVSAPLSSALSLPLSPVVPEQVSTPFEQTESVYDWTTTGGVFIHSDLPGFSFAYPKNWTVEAVKTFFDPQSKGFTSHYYGDTKPCSDACMGVRLTSDNISVEFLFDLAIDDGGGICDDALAFEKVGDYSRISGPEGLYYSKTLVTNYREEYPERGVYELDGSLAEKGRIYQACVFFSGSDLLAPTPEAFVNAGAILAEFPRVIGSPDQSHLAEIDAIVQSIAGID